MVTPKIIGEKGVFHIKLNDEESIEKTIFEEEACQEAIIFKEEAIFVKFKQVIIFLSKICKFNCNNYIKS